MKTEEIIDLTSKQWCTVDDLSKLANVGKSKALEIKKIIREDLISKGYYIPEKHVPMQAVADYLKIDINYLTKIIELQSKIKKG